VAAKELTSLVMDEDRLRSERSDRKLWKSRVSGLDEHPSGYGNEPPRRNERRRRPADDDDVEYRLAIEASKAEAEEERKRRAKTAGVEDDEDLAKAIKLSKEEEELRKRELEESNAHSLFDDTPVQAQPAQPTGYNQGYQQQSAVDWFGNPINPQQPLSTGYLNNQYAQPTGFQGQMTGMPNGYTNGFQSQQHTAFDQNPYGQPQNNYLQPQTTLQPQATLQPQQTAFHANNPYGATDMFGQPQQQPQDNFLSAGTNNPWATGSPQPADMLKPMATGSNNPFAQRTQPQLQTRPATSGHPSLNALAEERATTAFNPISNYQAPLAPAPPKSTPPQLNDPHHARLNALLATGEGQDTFGNVGDLRIPSQHTAPGTFVNSAGQGLDRLRANQTGNNPFFSQQQRFVPQQTSFAQPTGFGQQPGFAQPTNNPWGAQQSYQQQPQAGGSLIDL
jgi:epsin